MKWLDRLLRRPAVPDWLGAALEPDEYVLASAEHPGGAVVATSLGIWLPEQRRIDWHLVSKATWSAGSLELIEATQQPLHGAMLLSDLRARRLPLAEPGKLPQTVHQRVEASIVSRHRRDLDGGGVWVVQRKVAGRAVVQLQMRPDPGTDLDAVRRVAAEMARGIGLDG